MDKFIHNLHKVNTGTFDESKYCLTMKQLKRLVRDFQADCHDGFVSNDEAYIELWLKKNG